MTNVLRIAGKVVGVFAASIAVGYVSYRMHGGEPIRKVYQGVREERLAAEAAKAKATDNVTYIKGEGKIR